MQDEQALYQQPCGHRDGNGGPALRGAATTAAVTLAMILAMAGSVGEAADV